MEREIFKRSVVSRTPVDVLFENLTCRLGKKELLKSVSGRFSAGHLTAILGSSGAGKTSLLNVLAGQTQGEVTGTLRINGRPRETKTFRKMACYLKQEDLLRPLLSVAEALTVSASLKLGREFNCDEKAEVVSDVIDLMGLEKCADTRVENLSGGQRKRLSIALEIFSNPPVFFLDEPTTGLDNVMAKKFIEFLKLMAEQGRTIVCTIHQPSDTLFQLFDQAYFMSDGCCIYNGEANAIVPFLAGVGLPCPSNYSPFDYVIELVQSDEVNASKLKDAIDNGKQSYHKSRGMCVISENPDLLGSREEGSYPGEFPASFWVQSSVLTRRMWTQMKRDKRLLAIQFLPPIIVGVLKGLLFKGVGNDAESLIHNVHLLLAVTIHHLFTNMFPQLLLLPFEVKLLQREYRNRWYSLRAYYTALSVTTLPLAVVPAIVFSIPVYFLTDQPLEAGRIVGFMLVSICTAVTAQAFGQAIGSLLSPMMGAIVGSSMIAPLVLLSIYGTEETDMTVLMKFAMSLSFVRHSLAAYSVDIFEGRELMNCDRIFCYFRDPEVALKKLGLDGVEFYEPLIYLTLFLVAHKLCILAFLRMRMAPRFFGSFRTLKCLQYVN